MPMGLVTGSSGSYHVGMSERLDPNTTPAEVLATDLPQVFFIPSGSKDLIIQVRHALNAIRDHAQNLDNLDDPGSAETIAQAAMNIRSALEMFASGFDAMCRNTFVGQTPQTPTTPPAFLPVNPS